MGEAVLFVCTANICRSPMAEAMLKMELNSNCPELAVGSAGFLTEGNPADRKSIWAMNKLGIHSDRHVSVHVSTAVAKKPDLILAMAREHLRMLMELDPVAVVRAFTLKEFVRLAAIEGQRNPGETLLEYVRRVEVGRSALGITSPSREDDVADPIGQRKTAFVRCASELRELIQQLARCLCPETLNSPCS